MDADGTNVHLKGIAMTQRYLVYDRWWTPGGPILFYLGNEAPIETFYNNTGVMSAAHGGQHTVSRIRKKSPQLGHFASVAITYCHSQWNSK